jgi:hypothetical protein
MDAVPVLGWGVGAHLSAHINEIKPSMRNQLGPPAVIVVSVQGPHGPSGATGPQGAPGGVLR